MGKQKKEKKKKQRLAAGERSLVMAGASIGGNAGVTTDGGRHKEDAAEPPAKMKRKEYEKELDKLQVELVKLQEWVKYSGAKICVLFEGRDAAGKGGIIRSITERTSPRVFRVIALPSPTEREKTQMYFQRYMPHLPAAGEMVLFDRSWYNRAGVERVMGFTPPEQV